jgi:hypothetical protein
MLRFSLILAVELDLRIDRYGFISAVPLTLQ